MNDYSKFDVCMSTSVPVCMTVSFTGVRVRKL